MILCGCKEGILRSEGLPAVVDTGSCYERDPSKDPYLSEPHLLKAPLQTVLPVECGVWGVGSVSSLKPETVSKASLWDSMKAKLYVSMLPFLFPTKSTVAERILLYPRKPLYCVR